MARTLRRGKPSRNFHKYIGLGVIRNENIREHTCYSYPGGWYNGISDEPWWKENGFATYEEYVEKKIRAYHLMKRKPHADRWYFDVDRSRQTRAHKKAIHDAMRSGDFDVVLESLDGKVEWWD